MPSLSQTTVSESAVFQAEPASRRIRPDSIAFIFFLSALGGLTPLSIDMGLPALHAIGESLHVTPASTALTLSLFLFGFAFGPIVLGPLSDRFGRRPVLLGGSSVFALAGIGCALSSSLHILLFWRLLEGIGAGAGATLSLAVVRDLFDGATARTRLSYVGTIGSLAPMLAPTLGALVLAGFGWRAIYGFLALAGVALVLVIAFGFEESHRAINPTALQPRRLIGNYALFFQNRLCLGYTLVVSLTFGGMFSYISSSPLVMMEVLGVSPSFYGWTFAATAIGIMTGAFTNGRLNARGFNGGGLLSFGLGLSAFSSLSLVLISHSPWVSVSALLPVLILNSFGIGFIGPNATQGAMHPLPKIAGAASAALGSTRTLAGASAAVLVSQIFDGHTAHAMADSMSFFSASALAVYWGVVRPAERLEAVSQVH